MFGISPGKPATDKHPLKFVVAFRIDDDDTKQLMQRCVDSGFKPEQIARYALKRYLAELSKTSSGQSGGMRMEPQPLWRDVLPDQLPNDPAFYGWYEDINDKGKPYLELDAHSAPDGMVNVKPVKKADGWYWVGV